MGWFLYVYIVFEVLFLAFLVYLVIWYFKLKIPEKYTQKIMELLKKLKMDKIFKSAVESIQEVLENFKYARKEKSLKKSKESVVDTQSTEKGPLYSNPPDERKGPVLEKKIPVVEPPHYEDKRPVWQERKPIQTVNNLQFAENQQLYQPNRIAFAENQLNPNRPVFADNSPVERQPVYAERQMMPSENTSQYLDKGRPVYQAGNSVFVENPPQNVEIRRGVYEGNSMYMENHTSLAESYTESNTYYGNHSNKNAENKFKRSVTRSGKSSINRKTGKIELVQTGFISLFFSNANHVIIIPYAKDKNGKGRALNGLIYIPYPFVADQLGEAVFKAFDDSEHAAPCTDKELISKLKVKRWEEFTYGKRYISLRFDDYYGIVINTTTRDPQGAYRLNCPDGMEKVLRMDVDERELGETILNLLLRCK
ncbi:MAG: hypothetical protein N2645_07645 [Clostridia bacterium]|nr:hypothetical protein [Clostridia bacterium]